MLKYLHVQGFNELFLFKNYQKVAVIQLWTMRTSLSRWERDFKQPQAREFGVVRIHCADLQLYIIPLGFLECRVSSISEFTQPKVLPCCSFVGLDELLLTPDFRIEQVMWIEDGNG